MQILIIGSVWPEPNSSAAGSHMMQLISVLQARDWTVRFLSTAAKSEHAVDLKARNIETNTIKMNCDSFDHLLLSIMPDVVIFDRFMVEEQFGWRVAKHCPDALRILNTEDLHCLRRARERQVKKTQKVAHRLTSEELQNEDALREIAAIFRSDLSLMISQHEIALLKEQFSVPESSLIYVPFLYQGKLPKPAPFDARVEFMTIGSFRHAPNWDAVQWLNQAVWPLIRQQLPEARLFVYGSYPPKKATQLHQPKKGFYVKGWIEHVEEAFNSARVCLAPVRFGAGLKGKLYEAMIYGTPSIATSIGAEGFLSKNSVYSGEIDSGEDHTLQWNGVIADDAQTYADAAVALASNHTQWQQAQQNGYQIIKSRFEFQYHAESIANQIEQAKIALKKHRQNNFIGQLLNHHHQRSTEFMSRWIQEKEKNSDN